MGDLLKLHAFVSGRVQGVFFRGGTQTKARQLGLVGWVRNLRDGRVEVVAEGQDDSIEALHSWLRYGPSYARVDHVSHTKEHIADLEFSRFTVEYDY